MRALRSAERAHPAWPAMRLEGALLRRQTPPARPRVGRPRLAQRRGCM